MSQIENQFWELCDSAARYDKASCWDLEKNDTPDEADAAARTFEQTMVEIIKLVEANPQHRQTFVQCFVKLVEWERPAPQMLVPFCMRRLRFPEIRELIQRDAAAHVGTVYFAHHMNYWSDINHAYLDEVWEWAACFDFYRHEISGVG